jgi:hypothetical protein
MRRVQAADVILAVIGSHWAAAADDRARRGLLGRVDEDVMRLEIETAFTHGLIVIPVLVDDARDPGQESLLRPFRRSPRSRHIRCSALRGTATSRPLRTRSPASRRGLSRRSRGPRCGPASPAGRTAAMPNGSHAGSPRGRS